MLVGSGELIWIGTGFGFNCIWSDKGLSGGVAGGGVQITVEPNPIPSTSSKDHQTL